MKIAFYAPLKAPDHPVASGDRAIARGLMAALVGAGWEPEIMSRLRTFDRGDPVRQARLAAIGERVAARIVRRLEGREAECRPRCWLTYHLYYKAPDWIGPRVCARLGIPYVAVEASHAPRRRRGRWAVGHAAVERAIAGAAAVISLNPVDDECVRPLLGTGARLHRLAPFIDTDGLVSRTRHAARARAASALGITETGPWLTTVAMMRDGDKLSSYRLLGAALMRLRERDWRLLVVGDGAARAAVERALLPLGRDRVTFAGVLDRGAVATVLRASDLYLWPAVNEAFGMALIEAAACAVPVVCGDEGGVRSIVRHGRTGMVVPGRDAGAFAAAVEVLLDAPAERRRMASYARRVARTRHSLAAAAETLRRILSTLREPRR